MNSIAKFCLIILAFFLLISCGGDKPVKPKKAESKTPKTEVTKSEKAPTKKSSSLSVKTPDYDANKEANKEESKDLVQDEPVPPEQLKKAKEIIKSANPKDIDAKKLFRLHCTICHGAKGDMKINGAKDLSISEISLQESVAQIYFGKGLMTPYKNMLSEDQIVAVAKYAETLR